MASPPADITMSERVVRSLLAEQHPDLADRPLVELDAGWDNFLWRLGDDLVVRLPRRALAAPLAVNEQRWLPELAPRLSLPVPVPLRVGRPSQDYPWAWSIVPWLHGSPGDRAQLTAPEDAAQRLGLFLRALHHEAPSEAPRNPYRGAPLAHRAAAFEARFSELSREIDAQATRRAWDWALASRARDGQATWIHGDLHPANVLVDGGTLSAVLDFGDLCAGDPATDGAGAWLLLPSSALPTFMKTYGVDAELERRAVGWALLFALMLIAIGIDGRSTYKRVGHEALAKVIARFA